MRKRRRQPLAATLSDRLPPVCRASAGSGVRSTRSVLAARDARTREAKRQHAAACRTFSACDGSRRAMHVRGTCDGRSAILQRTTTRVNLQRTTTRAEPRCAVDSFCTRGEDATGARDGKPGRRERGRWGEAHDGGRQEHAQHHGRPRAPKREHFSRHFPEHLGVVKEASQREFV